MKTAANGNLFTIIDRLWLYAGESDAHQAGIDIINLGTHTVHGAMSLAAGGYTGDGGTGNTGYLDTGFNPSTAGGHYLQDSAHIGVYVNAAAGGTWIGAIRSDGGCYAYLTSGTFAAELNDGNFPAATISGNGLYIVSRTASTGWKVYKNGNATPIIDNGASTTSSGRPNNNIFVSAQCEGTGAPSGFTADPIKAAWFGGGLTAAQTSDLATLINAYMTAWGVNTGVF
jgi:hypothetical protein